MEIDTAPVADREGDAECDIEECGGTYVLYDGDRVCRRCGHLSGTGGDNMDQTYRQKQIPEPWVEYEQEREKYDGFHGEDRIKFPGGFAQTYDFGPDFGIGEEPR